MIKLYQYSEKVQGNSVFRESTTCSKILNGKNICSIQLIQDKLFFRAGASCSKLLNVKVYSIGPTVKNFRANSVFQDKRKLLKIPEW